MGIERGVVAEHPPKRRLKANLLWSTKAVIHDRKECARTVEVGTCQIKAVIRCYAQRKQNASISA